MKSQNAPDNPREKIIVALDVATHNEALHLVQDLSGEVGLFKIGLQLYTAAGPDVVRAVIDTGARVFLDLKLHDIPNTVGKAVSVAAELGIEMLTVHLSGGRAMIEAAVAASGGRLLLLGVTVLTSLDDTALKELGISATAEDHAVRLASIGAGNGVNGIVASPHEIGAIRRAVGDRVKIITPGVRPTWSEAGDQKRFKTPREAIKAGADYLVIGRPITRAANPREAVRRIVDEIAA